MGSLLTRGKGMDQNTLLLLIGAAVVGLVAVILMLRRERHERDDATRESPFGVSTEGEKVCPKCGGQNLWTATTCVFCGGPLRG
jgi:LPXTG-motif cell wall-anchored protein